jgi:hypothetical protein
VGVTTTIAKFSLSGILRAIEILYYPICSAGLSSQIKSILVTLKPEFDRKDFIILSALEKVKYGKIYTEIYGIIAGEAMQEIQQIENNLQGKGLQQ